MKLAISLLALLVIFSGYLFNESFAEVSENQAFLLEGSGFAITEEQIKFTEIDLGLSSQEQRGSTIGFVIEDGFITLDDEEFIISELEGKFLREGRYIRINGDIESSSGVETTISFFGRLVAESKDAAVYGFTGRITTSDDTYKIIYTTKLSSLSKINTTPTLEDTKEVAIHILGGSSSQGLLDSYVDAGEAQSTTDPTRLRYFSDDRISVEPGTTITIVNDDIVSHNIISGKENYGDRHNPFTPDERISTGDIAPGNSINITFDDAGFYRLYDPDYPWMKIVAYVFPNSDNLILREGQNLGN
ncbi:cupredoxin domain-containing protein [Nitrosopumilus sp.]|uniref:cupredoxin domain-containing protein n=1 Tax=Nitrosopumilus sp. TaxID=2024843 RepID=UPI003D110B66